MQLKDIGEGKKFDPNTVVEHYFLKMLSRIMMVVVLPVVIWLAAQVWGSLNESLDDIQSSLGDVQVQQRVITNDNVNIKNDIETLEDESLNSFSHFVEHRNKKGWFNATGSENDE